jgi:hypothetical protein
MSFFSVFPYPVSRIPFSIFPRTLTPEPRALSFLSLQLPTLLGYNRIEMEGLRSSTNNMSNAKPFAVFVSLIFVLFLMAGTCGAQEYGKFIVRSAPFAGKDEAVKLSNGISAGGYHPVIQTEKAGSDEYYYLEMGAFDNLDTALGLVAQLKSFGGDFFIMDGSGDGNAPMSKAALVNPGKMAKIFPYNGVPTVDQLSLLMNMAPPVTTGNDSTSNNQAPAGKPEFKKAGPKVLEKDTVKKIDTPDLSPAAKTLREMAWDLRGNGYEVYFDGETYKGPEGTLVGMFDNGDDADDLQSELESYGYEVKVEEKEMETGTKYMVFAVVDDTPPQIMTPDDVRDKYTSPDNDFNPPEDETINELLKLSHPKNNLIKKK